MGNERAFRHLAAYDERGLSRRRRRRVELLLERSADARRELERQRLVSQALAGIAVEAPASLRREVDSARAGARARGAARPGPVLALAAGSLAAVVIVTLIALLPSSGPTVQAMAALAHDPATESAPRATALDAPLLDRRFAGVQYPNWFPKFGWHPEGARTDTVDGRKASTVFYLHQGHRLAYTVVDGPPLGAPDGAREVSMNGVTVFVYRDGDHTVAAFERGGHTCVLAGHVLRESTAIELATWTGREAVRF